SARAPARCSPSPTAARTRVARWPTGCSRANRWSARCTPSASILRPARAISPACVRRRPTRSRWSVGSCALVYPFSRDASGARGATVSVSLPQLDSPPGVRTHCPYCAFQCGTVLTDTGEGAPRLAGDPAVPVNAGRLCVKGARCGGLLAHPDRLLTPLVRRKPASWDMALDAVADAFRHIQQESGHDAVGVFGSGALTNEKAYLLGKFARVALRTPHVDYNGRYRLSGAAAAGTRAFGIDRGLPFPVSDIALSRSLFVVGSTPFDTFPPIAGWFEKQRASGGRLVVADPRRTPTARA